MNILFQGSFLTLHEEDHVGVLTMDKKGEEMNIISLDIMDEFLSVLDKIISEDSIKAAVLISGKKSFMAGADIKTFLTFGPGEAAKVGQDGHNIFLKISQSPKPFVSAIHGACMGGGTELSLACAGRIASTHKSTMIALPEVKLGLLPGLGGTLRLPKLIGVQKALDMMLTGKNIFARQAIRSGLVDQIVEPSKLLTAAKHHALKIANGKYKRKDKRSFLEKILDSALLRSIVFKKAGEMVMRSTRGNYPAPLKIIESVRYGMSHSLEKGIINETKLFDELLQTPESWQLIHLFFGMTDLKKNPWKKLARPVEELAVLGAGLMGEGIAEVSLNKEINVHLKDISKEMLASARKNIRTALRKKVKRKIISDPVSERLMNKLYSHLDYSAFKKTTMVIEAVFEDLSLKHRVLNEVELNTGSETIFASNTSALPISKIAEKASRPGNVIGMHYFSPVQKMPLLEIIATKKTEDWVKATALELGIQQGKTCIVVNDGPGFYTTRILAPFMNEALLMIEEGVDILKLESIMKDFGFPVGPITLMDEVGIDVGAHINEGDLGKFFENRGERASSILNTLASHDFKGRKNKKGFWVYDEQGKKIRGKVNPQIFDLVATGNAQISNDDIQDRMTYIMLNEAIYCLEEGILSSSGDGDIGAVFGLGFPPFRGGPFRFMDSEGIPKTYDRMNELSQKYGKRFTPSPYLIGLRDSNSKFYPE